MSLVTIPTVAYLKFPSHLEIASLCLEGLTLSVLIMAAIQITQVSIDTDLTIVGKWVSSEGKTFSGKVTEKVENQLEGFLDDHLNCMSDSETQFNDQDRRYRPLHTCVDIVSKSCRQSIVENSCLIDAEVMQHSGHIERDCEQCNGASKSKINGATSVADALLRKKEPNKSKRTSELKLTRLFQNDRLGPSASYTTERRDINVNSVWLESVQVEECLGAISGRD
ncbi:hypothetical protein Acr_03g0004030 [Actinidia rufa]|uniref:Uncharacterized protein n=1 Tax=Actinidia rufa TaxID=165716 RepID=A0A7J0ECP0_9ERIC|nr:hypothetical protein Acr_03g0004030 [Actinidia rufa]